MKTTYTLSNGMQFRYECKSLSPEQVVGIADDLLMFERERMRLGRRLHPPVQPVVAEVHGTTTRTVKRIKRRLKDEAAWPKTVWKK